MRNPEMPDCHLFCDDGSIPNNPDLPLLHYRGVFAVMPTMSPKEALAAFERNGWSNGWVNGVYAFHHYHATSHEVLAICAGHAEIMFGGRMGRRLAVGEGDCVVIPAGVGHCRVGSSDPFVVVGAYPDGMDWDLRRETPADRTIALLEISRVPLPRTDPVYGKNGPLMRLWQGG